MEELSFDLDVSGVPVDTPGRLDRCDKIGLMPYFMYAVVGSRAS